MGVNDKLRRLRIEFDAIRAERNYPSYFDDVVEAFDRICAEPGEPSATADELLLAADAAAEELRAALNYMREAGDPARAKFSESALRRLKAAIAKARPQAAGSEAEPRCGAKMEDGERCKRVDGHSGPHRELPD